MIGLTRVATTSNPNALANAQSTYQALRLDEPTLRSIQRKYQKLETILAKDEAIAPSEWKALVSDYPGSLREVEMCAPKTLKERARAAMQLQIKLGSSRRELLDEPLNASLILWQDLHQLLGELQQWRASEDSRNQDVGGFLAWVNRQPNCNSRVPWPASGASLITNQRGRPTQHTAYAWLSMISAIAEKALLERLLDRLGARRAERPKPLNL